MTPHRNTISVRPEAGVRDAITELARLCDRSEAKVLIKCFLAILEMAGQAEGQETLPEFVDEIRRKRQLTVSPLALGAQKLDTTTPRRYSVQSPKRMVLNEAKKDAK